MSIIVGGTRRIRPLGVNESSTGELCSSIGAFTSSARLHVAITECRLAAVIVLWSIRRLGLRSVKSHDCSFLAKALRARVQQLTCWPTRIWKGSAISPLSSLLMSPRVHRETVESRSTLAKSTNRSSPAVRSLNAMSTSA